MKNHQALLEDIDRCTVRQGECALWWLGQLSYVFKLGRKIIYLDAFLSPHPKRQIPPLLAPEEVTHADLILGTHDHGDHIDRPAWPVLARSSPAAGFVVPDLLLPRLAAEVNIPRDRFIGLDDGAAVELDGIRITGIAAAHEFLDRDQDTGRYPYLGYVIEGNGFTLYHAGDCCVYEGLLTKLRPWKLDLACLPINGRDARRLAANCIGNMTYQEAADLAGALAPGCTLPAHYDMFAENSENPQLFADYMRVKYPQLKVMLCDHGEGVILAAKR